MMGCSVEEAAVTLLQDPSARAAWLACFWSVMEAEHDLTRADVAQAMDTS